MKIKLFHDLFNIVGRVKSIDSHYEIVFDTERKCFEIHNSRQTGNTFCLSVDSASLDSRVVDKLLRSRNEFAREIFNEIDDYNLKLARLNNEKTKEEIYTKIHQQSQKRSEL